MEQKELINNLMILESKIDNMINQQIINQWDDLGMILATRVVEDKIIVLFKDENQDFGEDDCMVIAKRIIDSPNGQHCFIWPDRDCISWKIDFGVNVHGIPDEILEQLGIDNEFGEDSNELQIFWVVVQLTDYAS